MKRPAVFFDRDNTLIVSDGYLGDPDGVVLVDGAPELVARVRQLGYAAVTFSNQSGVARGLFTEQDVHRVNSRLDEMLVDHEAGAVIDRHEFCPHHPEAVVPRYRQASEFRKPSPGMIYQAARQLGLDLSRSWVVGDAPRDIEAGRAAGCRTILFKDPALPASAAAGEPMTVEPDFVAASLKEVGDLIENNPPAGETADAAPIAEVQPDVPVGPEVRPILGEAASVPPVPSPAVFDGATAGEGTGGTIGRLPNGAINVAGPTDIGQTLESVGGAEEVAAVEEGAVESAEPAAVGEADSDVAAAEPQAGSGDTAHSTGVANSQEQGSNGHDTGLPAVAVEEPTPSDHDRGLEEQTSAAPVEAAVTEEPAAAVADYGSPQPAEEPVMDDTSTPNPASGSGVDSETAGRRRSPPAVILAAKAAREAARSSAPNASPEVLREVARNAAREAAMGITRDYTAAAPEETSAHEPLFESTSDSPRQPEPTAPAYESAPTNQPAQTTPIPVGNLHRLEDLAEQILTELRRRNDAGADFSVSKLMAGITMVMSVALLVYAYLYKDNPTTLNSLLLLGLMLQAITISLLIMGRQR